MYSLLSFVCIFRTNAQREIWKFRKARLQAHFGKLLNFSLIVYALWAHEQITENPWINNLVHEQIADIYL